MAIKHLNHEFGLIFAAVLGVVLAGCAGDTPKPVTSVSLNDVTYVINKCKQVKNNLECPMRFKTQGKAGRFFIGTDKSLVPVATDDTGKSYSASELYINGAEQMNRWYTISTFKDLPGIIVFPDFAGDAKTVTRLSMPVATHKLSNPDPVVFSYINIGG